MRLALRIPLFLSLSSLAAAVQAQQYQVGDTANCAGNVGEVIRIDPRPGWDEPFVVVETRSKSGVSYEWKCVPSDLRPVPASTPAAAPADPRTTQPASTPSSSPPPPPTVADVCKVGAKLEGQWGISWYDVTVLAAADDGCKVHFNGYDPMWDTVISLDQLRPRGSGEVYKPRNPVADQPAAENGTAAAIPDGTYECSKITPGSLQLMHVGTLTVRNGLGSVAGMPEGWAVREISSRGRNERGELVVGVYYRSSSGFNDGLDCIAK